MLLLVGHLRLHLDLLQIDCRNRHYDTEGMDPEDLIGRTPVLARVTAIEEKISDAFANP